MIRLPLSLNLARLLCLVSVCGFPTVLRSEPARVEKPLVVVSNPPPIQMLVPGFTVRELPLDLNNINNLVFAPDGRLFALCYDGNVLQLLDTNGDGLEDSVVRFFRNTNNVILPSIGMCWGPGGLYIASQGRVIRLRDKGDGTGELEVVAKGWPGPTSPAGSNLDAIGVAVNKAGEIFFGIGCDAWNQAYRVNKVTGKSEYDIHSERGTIQKISADWKKRETVCTGMRFPVGMAFNAAGDLFTTDQEGATWLPNGNPFDELLHIQPGRHYGFPPRHPKYLPDVIDEPSTFDYAPQHQSTCGLHFNEPIAGGKKIFGPDWWRGDAIICGESRGKIWRTKLVKTAAGYVAQSQLIACLTMLTVDATPTPQGDLLVACHSGKPDWGTGPQGKGKLFKISYTPSPQPVLTFAKSPTETQLVFDGTLDMKGATEFASLCGVTMGRYVTAGEQFESFRPGYQVVKNQQTMPRFSLTVSDTRITDGNRSMILGTAMRTEAVSYAVAVPDSLAGRGATNSRVISYGAIDLLADLTGVEATWQSASGQEKWSGWLPHLDLMAAHGFTTASANHQELFRSLKKRGALTLRTQLDLWSMLHPAVQPESKLDFEYPPEKVTVLLKASADMTVKVGSATAPVIENEARIAIQPKENRWLPIEVTLATGAGEPKLDVSWFTAEDTRPRPLPLRRILLPWAKPYIAAAMLTRVPELDGGDWERGKKIFFNEPAICFKCHTIHGEGGTIGPNLSNLIYRDYASVLRDITEPSTAINPEHISYNVELKDGEAQTGVLLKNDDNQVVLGLVNGENLTIPKSKVASMKASAVSLMPEGLLKALDAQHQKDLMTFLLMTSQDRTDKAQR